MTGRWRLMDESDAFKEYEADSRVVELQKIKRKYKDRILPANHGLSRKMRNIAQDILKANDLGYVKNEPGFYSTVYQLFGHLFQVAYASVARSGKSGVPVNDEKSRTRKDSLKNQEWEVIVIDDPENFNASALPGEEDVNDVHN